MQWPMSSFPTLRPRERERGAEYGVLMMHFMTWNYTAYWLCVCTSECMYVAVVELYLIDISVFSCYFPPFVHVLDIKFSFLHTSLTNYSPSFLLVNCFMFYFVLFAATMCCWSLFPITCINRTNAILLHAYACTVYTFSLYCCSFFLLRSCNLLLFELI